MQDDLLLDTFWEIGGIRTFTELWTLMLDGLAGTPETQYNHLKGQYSITHCLYYHVMELDENMNSRQSVCTFKKSFQQHFQLFYSPKTLHMNKKSSKPFIYEVINHTGVGLRQCRDLILGLM